MSDRRRPTIVMPFEPGQAYIRQHKYTGAYTVHAIEGESKRIELPNPTGWVDSDEREPHSVRRDG